MGFYAYKACVYEIPKEFRDQWEKDFLNETGREPDGDSNYDGDNWHLAADYIKHLQNKINQLENNKEKEKESG